jgi:hypothetical protein
MNGKLLGGATLLPLAIGVAANIAASPAASTSGASTDTERFAIDRASCPPVGKHNSSGKLVVYGLKTDEGMRNEAKRHLPSGDTPVTLQLDDFAQLQKDVDDATGKDAATVKSKFAPTRDVLRNLKVNGKTLSEGDLVQLPATMTVARDEHDESVNCEGNDGADIHINVGPADPPRSEYRGIVVEMIPQLPRPTGWDAATLVGLQGHQVLVVGGLTYDNEHFVNKDPNHPKTGQPARISLWEIHPITAFFVCPKDSCDPGDRKAWVTLTDFANNK